MSAVKDYYVTLLFLLYLLIDILLNFLIIYLLLLHFENVYAYMKVFIFNVNL